MTCYTELKLNCSLFVYCCLATVIHTQVYTRIHYTSTEATHTADPVKCQLSRSFINAFQCKYKQVIKFDSRRLLAYCPETQWRQLLYDYRSKLEVDHRLDN